MAWRPGATKGTIRQNDAFSSNNWLHKQTVIADHQIIRLSHIPFTRRFIGDITLYDLSMHLLASKQYQGWRTIRRIDELEPVYENPKSFYGKHFINTVPGVFLCTRDRIIHWSFGPSETPMGAFSKESKTEVNYSDIKRIAIEGVGILWAIAFLFPKCLLTVETKGGSIHQFIFYDAKSKLTEALNKVGLYEHIV